MQSATQSPIKIHTKLRRNLRFRIDGKPAGDEWADVRGTAPDTSPNFFSKADPSYISVRASIYPGFPIWTSTDERRRPFCVGYRVLCVRPNSFWVRSHQNLDDWDGQLSILTHQIVFRPHASRLSPSPQTFRKLFTLPVIIPRPPFAVGAARFAQGSAGTAFEGRRPPPFGRSRTWP